ncbi:FAD-binding oxidoreductase [bacterium]|nr:FAD-binding oxidoreductase [bacterium]
MSLTDWAALTDCPLFTDDERRRAVSRDEWPLATPVVPLAVAVPTHSDHVRQVLSLSHSRGIPVVVRGGGSSTTGASLPVENGLVLDLSGLTRMALDPVNQCLTAEPGVILSHLHRTVEAAGWFYPPDPASLARCTIGGTVAQNAGGPRCVKYGVTRDYVWGLSGYYPDGTPFSWGGKIRKNVAGLDLIGLMVGSEGILGVITQVILRLIPKPAAHHTQLIGVSSMADALHGLSLLQRKGVTPSVADYFPHLCVQAVASMGGPVGVIPDYPYYVLLEWDGSVADVTHTTRTVFDTLASIPADPITVDEATIWTMRRSMSAGLRHWGIRKSSHDITIPLSALTDYMAQVEATAHTWGLTVVGYGHLGDGNIHLNVLGPHVTDDTWAQVLAPMTDHVLQLALDYGGTLSGEHGIGLAKKERMAAQFSSRDLAVMRAIKQAFDPNGLLNPGKVLPSD